MRNAAAERYVGLAGEKRENDPRADEVQEESADARQAGG
jgi:hypothetical protein